MGSQHVLSILLLSLCTIQIVSAGILELNLNNLINDEGRLEDGTCCSDGRKHDKCTEPCKTFFRVCVKHFENRQNVKSCPLAEFTTPVLGNNTFDLNSILVVEAGFTNPLRVPFNFSWPGKFSLEIEAWHENYFSSGQSSNLEKRLIFRFTAQRHLNVGAKPVEKFHRINNTTLKYSYRVLCDPNYYGESCNKLCKPRNDMFGHYTCNESGTPVCIQGWKGQFCTEPICSKGCEDKKGICRSPDKCVCNAGWTGERCDKCKRHPGCVHGSCKKPGQCICDPGWGGLLCDMDLNFCESHKLCKNGGICENSGPGEYTCRCPYGFEGKNCEIPSNPCRDNPCKNNSKCWHTNNGTYTCICQIGSHGKNCETVVGTCSEGPCKNGTCVDGLLGPVCICTPGFTGKRCESELKDCSINLCQNGGHCNTHNSSYTCTCLNGYTGRHCEQKIDECKDSPCQNGATCSSGNGKFTCHCKPGFSGDRCEININECKPGSCKNDGICKNEGNTIKCICPPGFSGKYCQNSANDCTPNPCMNGASCVNKMNDYKCICKPGFTGSRCQHRLPSNQQNFGRPLSDRLADSAPHSIRRGWPVAEAQAETSEDGQQFWLVMLLGASMPLSALLVFVALRIRAHRHLLNARNVNNGLPCKSLDEVDAIRQNETNSNLLNNTNVNNAVCSKLGSSANIIVNALHSSNDYGHITSSRRASLYGNHLDKSATLKMQNCSPSVYGSMHYGTLGMYDPVESHPAYASFRPAARPQSLYGMSTQANVCPSDGEQRAALAAAAADYAASLYGINKSTKY